MTIQAFTAFEVESLHNTNQSSLLDRCTVSTPTVTYNEIGEPVTVWQDTPNIVCGFAYSRNATRETRGEMPNLEYDATLRLLPDTEITYQSKVTITHKMGVALGSPATYEVASVPNTGTGLVVVNLKGIVQ